MTTTFEFHDLDKINPDERGQMQVRHIFRQWLRQHRRRAQKTPIQKLMKEFHGRISHSSAYRIALKEGLRGRRHNSSRYTEFWEMINWALPDHSLEQIWGVSRQNVRHRRVRLGAGEPKFSARGQTWPDDFISAFNREIEKEQNYHGPRPR